METIICTLCETEKGVNQFYKNKLTSTGYANQCKECVKTRAKKREEALRQDSEWVENERTRGRDKYHRLNYKDKEVNREVRKKASREYDKKYPEKKKAKSLANKLRKEGFHNHHWSYNEEHYEDIIYLDNTNHVFLHRFLKYDQERMMYRCSKATETFSEGELLDTKERHLDYFTSLQE